jgi:hypothetical protein
VRGFEAEREGAVRFTVEANAEACELFDCPRSGAGETIDNGFVADPIACGYRVGAMQRGHIVRPERRRHPGLRPERRAFGANARFRQDHDRPRRKLERRHETGDARADDNGASPTSERRDAHSASIRSTARRAGAAIAGSILTSPPRVSRARRMFLSVMRFMCGQSAQGRTNSTSG